jgi:hypothetical protein
VKQERSMNVAAVVRRTEQIATREHVDLVVDRGSERLEKMIHLESKSTIK